MKVWLDPDLCTGCGCCEMIAPEVFHLGDNGLSSVKGEVVGGIGEEIPIVRVNAGHRVKVIAAAEECPGEIITVEFD